jgi:hypothetical protein
MSGPQGCAVIVKNGEICDTVKLGAVAIYPPLRGRGGTPGAAPLKHSGGIQEASGAAAPAQEVLNQCAALLRARLRTGVPTWPIPLSPGCSNRIQPHRDPARQGFDRPPPWSFFRIAPGRSPLPHCPARLHAIRDACGQDTLPIGPARPAAAQADACFWCCAAETIGQ